MPVPGSTPFESAPSGSKTYIDELYEKSKAAEFGLGEEEFLDMLREVSAKHLSSSSFEQFTSNLRVEDLALARACAAGRERAWEVFMLRFREKLYDIARQITREDSSGRELADSVYADLFGMKTRQGVRLSKLATYSGRGSLQGWLRTVLAQEYVNTYRRQRRLVSLEQESEEGLQLPALSAEPSSPGSSRLEQATEEALQSLGPDERFLLASYFLDGRTLAEIARALSLHESTISRKLDKLTNSVRKKVLKNLVRSGMTRRQAEEVLSTDVRDLAVDLRASLAQDSVARAFSEKPAKAGEGP